MKTFLLFVIGGTAGALVGVLSGLIAAHIIDRRAGLPVGLVVGTIAAVVVGALANTLVLNSNETPSASDSKDGTTTDTSGTPTSQPDPSVSRSSTPSDTADTVPPPEVSLDTTPAAADVSAPIAFTYSVTGETANPPELQRTAGTAGVFQTVQTLTVGADQTVQIPAPEIAGVFEYRVRATSVDGDDVTSENREVRAYAQIPLATLCQSAVEVEQCFASPGSITYGPRTFTAIIKNSPFGSSAPPKWDQLFDYGQPTSCASIHVEFATEHYGNEDDQGESHMHVIQSNSDEQAATAPDGTVGVLDAMLDGSPFVVETNATNDKIVFANGYARCFTDTGMSTAATN